MNDNIGIRQINRFGSPSIGFSDIYNLTLQNDSIYPIKITENVAGTFTIPAGTKYSFEGNYMRPFDVDFILEFNPLATENDYLTITYIQGR
jgi:hypothetical protein